MSRKDEVGPGIHFDVITCKYYVCFPGEDRIFEHYHRTQAIKYADKNYPNYFDCTDNVGRVKSIVYHENRE